MNITIILLLSLILSCIIIFGYRHQENFQNMPVDVIDDETKYEVESIIDIILEDINKKFNKNLLRGAIDRVEKTVKDDSIKYCINIFIYNHQKSTNRKTEFNVTIKDDTVFIDKYKKWYFT